MTGDFDEIPGCPFCAGDKELYGTDLAYALADIKPVTPGHTLVIARRHATTWFELTAEEHAAIDALILQTKQYLDERYHPLGYNVGFNAGAYAGQSVMHCHIHVMPRYKSQHKRGDRGILHLPPSLA